MLVVTVTSRRIAVTAALTAVLSVQPSCSDPVEPISLVNPPLSMLAFDGYAFAIPDWGLLVISGAPLDSSYKPASRQRIPVSIQTRGGDSETVNLWLFACGTPPSIYACQELDLVMKNGERADSLQQVMEQIPARFLGISVSGEAAGVRVFDPAVVPRALDLLRAQSNVQYAANSTLFFPATTLGTTSSLSSALTGALPIGMGAAVPGDGHLQLLTLTDTVIATYVQPDSSVLGDTIEVSSAAMLRRTGAIPSRGMRVFPSPGVGGGRNQR